MTTLRRIALAVAAAAILVAGTACGPNGPRAYPVRGEVYFAGKPAAGAVVTLHPAREADPLALLPSGRVQEDGSFKLSTYRLDDGAPAGEYEVSIIWFGDKDTADSGTGEMPNKLPARYSDPKTSQLRATVKQEPTVLPRYELSK